MKEKHAYSSLTSILYFPAAIALSAGWKFEELVIAFFKDQFKSGCIPHGQADNYSSASMSQNQKLECS